MGRHRSAERLLASVAISNPVGASYTKAGCPISASTTATCISETDYFYDEPGYLATPTPAVTTQHTTAIPGVVRGNQTTVRRWLVPGNTSIDSHVKWYDTGEPFQEIDPLGHTTAISYDQAYAGAYPT